MDKHCSEQQFPKSDVIALLYRNSGAVHLVQPDLTAVRQAGRQTANLEFLKFKILGFTALI